MVLNYGVGEDSWESLGLQGNPTSPSWRKSALNIHWKDWCWSWSSNTLALSDAKSWLIWKDTDAGKDWRWEERGRQRMRCWMASPTQWTWIWVNSGSWWWTGKPGVLQSMGHEELDTTERLNWTEHHRAAVFKTQTLLLGLPHFHFIHPFSWNYRVCLTVRW